MGYRSYAFTIRPLSGVPEGSAFEKGIIDMVRKYKGFVAFEMEEGARHLHGQIYFEKPKRKHDFNEMMNTIAKRSLTDWCYDQQRVMYQGTEIAYSDGWILDYTNKPDSSLLYMGMPDDTRPYYPSEEEQKSVMARARAVDKQLHHLVELWKEYNEEQECEPLHAPDTEEGIAVFLYDMMFVQKKIRVIKEKRKISEMRSSLYHYINGEGLTTTEKLKYMIPS